MQLKHSKDGPAVHMPVRICHSTAVGMVPVQHPAKRLIKHVEDVYDWTKQDPPQQKVLAALKELPCPHARRPVV